MKKEAIAAIRMRAELARRLSDETRQSSAKESLRHIASILDLEADQLEQEHGEHPDELPRQPTRDRSSGTVSNAPPASSRPIADD